MSQNQKKTQEEQRKYVDNNPPGIPVDRDQELEQKTNVTLSLHSEQYTKLLQVYVSDFEKNANEKGQMTK